MPNTDDPLALFDKIYDKPWTRLGPYLVGMSVGWILFKTNCKIKFTKVKVFIRTWFSVWLNFALPIGPTNHWMVNVHWDSLVSSVRTLQNWIIQSSCRSLQFSKSFSLGYGVSLDSHRLLNRQRWIPQQIPFGNMLVSLFTSHILRIPGASNRDKIICVEFRRSTSYGCRLNGK